MILPYAYLNWYLDQTKQKHMYFVIWAFVGPNYLSFTALLLVCAWWLVLFILKEVWKVTFWFKLTNDATEWSEFEPVTPIECFELKPMTPFGCYNLKPMTPCGCCNLKPMTLFRVLYITKIISFFLFSPKWKSFSNFQLNSCDQYKNTFLLCMIYVYVTGSL